MLCLGVTWSTTLIGKTKKLDQAVAHGEDGGDKPHPRHSLDTYLEELDMRAQALLRGLRGRRRKLASQFSLRGGLIG